MVNNLNDQKSPRILELNVLGRSFRNKVSKLRFSIKVAKFIKFPLKKTKKKKIIRARTRASAPGIKHHSDPERFKAIKCYCIV